MKNYIKSINLPENATLSYDQQEINEVLENCGFPEEYAPEITAVAVVVDDGDYSGVWVSESSSPYNLSAIWHALPFYKPEGVNSDKWPHYWQTSNPLY